MELDACKSHENLYIQISSICIDANLMKMYTCKSHEENVSMQIHGNIYIQISWKWINANLIELDTWKFHGNGYMQIALKMDTWKSHENLFTPISYVYMQIS